jgi:origin recognition complex subunit 4
MAYAEYVDLASKARIQSAASGAAAAGAVAKVWGREVARGEWEGLVRMGLLIPVSENQGAGGMCKIDVRLEEIVGAVDGISSLMERWCKQL